MKRSGFSMIELVFVIVILGVLAAVAVPRFVATRVDAQVAAARSDVASLLKAVPSKIFADNIDATQSKVDNQNWNNWMAEIGGLDRKRWSTSASYVARKGVWTGDITNSGLAPTVSGVGEECGVVMSIHTRNVTSGGGISTTEAALIFDPANANSGTGATGKSKAFCGQFAISYQASGVGGAGNRVVPLTTASTMVY